MAKKSKLLAIRNEKGKGVYKYITVKERNQLLLEHTGKLNGISYRIFKNSEKEDALIWTGLATPPNTEAKKPTATQKAKKKVSTPMTKKKFTSHKLPQEIDLDVIHIGMDCRTYLQWYYSQGGDKTAFGEFKGKVKKITKNSILFEKLYIEFDELCGDCVEGKEEHIWISGTEPFIKEKVKVGDCVAFTGLAYAYKRKNGSIDFSLKECEDIEIIQEYELPTDEALVRQSAERLACEVCLYSEHCDGLVCIAADGYLETMTASILDAQKNLKLQ